MCTVCVCVYMLNLLMDYSHFIGKINDNSIHYSYSVMFTFTSH